MANIKRIPVLRPDRAREIVRRIIRQHFGSKPSHIQRQGGGQTNLVFSVSHDAGEFIARLNPDPAMLGIFLKQHWAVELAGGAGVPVPEVVLVGSDPMPHMILRRAPGEPATFHPDRLRIVHDLGCLAVRINSICTRGFGGEFDAARNQPAFHPDWGEFLRTEVELDKRLRVLEKLRMATREQLQTVRGILESACGKGRKPMLNHGDLRPKNVMIDGKGRISAILDWDNCSSNLAPEWELSLALHDLAVDEKEAFLRGYGLDAKAVSKMAQTMKAFNLVNYVPAIERLVKKKDKARLEFYRLRLSGALDLYSL